MAFRMSIFCEPSRCSLAYRIDGAARKCASHAPLHTQWNHLLRVSHLIPVTTLPLEQVGRPHFASCPRLRNRRPDCFPFPVGLSMDYGNPDSNEIGANILTPSFSRDEWSFGDKKMFSHLPRCTLILIFLV